MLIVGAGDGGRLVLREILRNPELGLRPGRLRRRRPAQAAACAIDRGLEVLGHDRRARRASSTRSSPTRSLIAIPSAPGTLRARVVARVPRARHPGAHDADRLRAAADRRRARHAPGARGPASRTCSGREPVRMEIERVGAYLAGEVVMVTGAGGSIGSELCRQIARVGPRAADPGRPRRGQPVRDPSASSRRTATSARRGRRARRLQGGGADARGVRRAPARRSSSTPPPTSTSALMEVNPVEAVRNNALATRADGARRRRARRRARSCSSPPTRRSRRRR